jgi:nucleoside-diphosphate-sugar epimerase
MGKETILLTGATGFLGSYLLKSLLQTESNIIILKRSFSNVWRISEYLTKVKFYDIDKTPLSDVFKENDIDCIIHTACSYGRGGEGDVKVIKSNLLFGLELVELGVLHSVKTFINTGSVLPKNINVYSMSKAHLSEWLSFFSNKIQVIDLKFEHIYGPLDDQNKFIHWLINKIRSQDEQIKLTSGEQKRDFIFIDDVVEVYKLVLSKKKQLKSFNLFEIGSGKLTKVKDFVSEISKKLEEIDNVNYSGKLKFGEIPYRPNDIMVPILDNSKILDLGWVPKVFPSEGINKLLKK